MTENLKKAKQMLISENYTCVLLSDNKEYHSTLRGVRPLIDLLELCADFSDFSAADKVIGAGAAYLYVLLGIREIWAITVSERAKNILTAHEIQIYYDNCVAHIINRAGDGICPIECAVADAASPEDAYSKIKEALKRLNA